MDHASIEELIPAYALGATDPAESQAVQAHLPTCSDCRALLASYSDLGGVLLYATPPISAPRGMTERMQRRLAQPRQDVVPAPRWARLRSKLLVPGLAFAVLLLGDLQPLLVRPHKRSPAPTDGTGFAGRQPGDWGDDSQGSPPPREVQIGESAALAPALRRRSPVCETVPVPAKYGTPRLRCDSCFIGAG